jgi:predicted secreted protein
MQRLLLGAAILAAGMVSVRADATEASSWAILGFSADGQYLAWERFGTHDGSGFPYSTIFILSTEKNQYAVPPISCELETEGAPEASARKANLKKAEAALTRFGIEKRHLGEKQRLLKQTRVPTNSFGQMARATAQFQWRGALWTLVLQEVWAKSGKDEDGGLPRMLDLRLQGNGKEWILQKDNQLPRSRGLGVYFYDLVSVQTYQSFVAVVVEYSYPGYEGPNTNQLVVTGKVP